jgi:8-oxo-dGTP pyrophosphatase MutT (NUDIX family)
LPKLGWKCIGIILKIIIKYFYGGFMERHFCVSVYVYCSKNDNFLFIKHKKLKKWLTPGGHWENNEFPDDTALREVLEETGLKVTLIGERLPRETDQIRPYGIQRNIIKDGEHEHLDLIYLAFAEDEKEIKQNYEETDGINWFSIKEIDNETFDTFRESRKWCRYFHDKILEGKIC